MRAIITTGYGSPEVFQIKDIKKPKPKNNEVLIKIHASSVTKADTMMRTGKPYIGRLFLGLTKPKMPIWGTGFAGTIEAIGNQVTQFDINDKVFGESIQNMGTYAEYICIPEDGIISKIPENWSFDQSAGLCDGGITSLNFLFNLTKIKARQKVLINGASGALGTAAIQIAKYFNAEVTGVCSTKNLDLVKKLNADHVIDYTKEDFTLNFEKYDIIYDTVGSSTFGKCKKALKDGGMYLSPVLNSSLLCNMLFTSLFGNKKAKFTATGMLPQKEIKKLLQLLLKMIERKQYTNIMDRSYSLDQIKEAHLYVEKGHKKGNVTIKPL